MTLLDAGAVVAGIGSSWASSTKWPSGSCTITARVLFVALIASGTPPVVTTGTPAAFSFANAASMSRTSRISVTAPGSCMRRRTGGAIDVVDLHQLDAAADARHARADETQARLRQAVQVQVAGILVPRQRPGRRRRHQVQPEQVVVEARGAIEVVDDRADVAGAGDGAGRRPDAAGGADGGLRRQQRGQRDSAAAPAMPSPTRTRTQEADMESSILRRAFGLEHGPIRSKMAICTGGWRMIERLVARLAAGLAEPSPGAGLQRWPSCSSLRSAWPALVDVRAGRGHPAAAARGPRTRPAVVGWRQLPNSGGRRWPFAAADIETMADNSRRLERTAGVGYNEPSPMALVEPRRDHVRPGRRASPATSSSARRRAGARAHLDAADDVAGATGAGHHARALATACGGSRDVLGRRVPIAEQPFTIVGVMPADVEYPRGVEAWMTVAALQTIASNQTFREAMRDELEFVARLRPDTTLAQASAELRSIAPALEAHAGERRHAGAAGARPGLVQGIARRRRAAGARRPVRRRRAGALHRRRERGEPDAGARRHPPRRVRRAGRARRAAAPA